ncbi:MAG: type II secretion system F family protein [Syntrophales bacterium]
MPNYFYKAINEQGGFITGDIEAESAEIAAGMLADRGYIPSKVTEKKTVGAASQAGWWQRLNQKLSPVGITDLIIFTKQFRSLFKAGVPLVRSFQVLEAQTEDRTLKAAISVISQDIKSGSGLSAAMNRHGTIFSPLYRSMIKAGEMSGTVPEALDRLIYIIEHEGKIKSDIKSALQYPMVVCITLTIAFFVLLTFVVPKFASMFSKSGLTLPIPTQIAIMLYQFLFHYWHLLIFGLIALIVGLKSFFKTEQGEYIKDSLILRIPFLGPLFIKAAMSRFASIFGMLYSSGTPVINAMTVLSSIIGNKAIAREFDGIREQIKEGRGIAVPLGSSKYFTPMVVDMVAIGEETGNIEEMLLQVTEHYDDEVSYTVKRLSDLIGPVLIVALAAVVGFFALAIFLPMWNLTQMAK